MIFLPISEIANLPVKFIQALQCNGFIWYEVLSFDIVLCHAMLCHAAPWKWNIMWCNGLREHFDGVVAGVFEHYEYVVFGVIEWYGAGVTRCSVARTPQALLHILYASCARSSGTHQPLGIACAMRNDNTCHCSHLVLPFSTCGSALLFFDAVYLAPEGDIAFFGVAWTPWRWWSS